MVKTGNLVPRKKIRLAERIQQHVRFCGFSLFELKIIQINSGFLQKITQNY